VVLICESGYKLSKRWGLDLGLQLKYKNKSVTQCTQKGRNFIKGLVLMVDKGDDEKFKGLESGQKFFSKTIFWVDLYEVVVGLHFMRKHPDHWELRKTTTIH
jgi:hypothetical protein